MMVACVVGAGSCLEPEHQDRPPQCECGLPPRCGQPCAGSCGCCPSFGTTCSVEGIRRGSPNADCYDVIPCSAPNRCVTSAHGAVCADSKADCDAVREAYEAPLQSSLTTTLRSGSGPLAAGTYPSYCPEACKVSPGHCAQGLDTCWFLSYGPDAELDRLANLYRDLGCPSLGACDCPPEPRVSCQYDSSGASGSYSGPLACTVE
jgi:hypothetical protein